MSPTPRSVRVEHGFAPLCVVVLDTGGDALVVKRDERSSIGLVEIATGKAHEYLAIGFEPRELARRADAMPKFFTALANVFPKGIVPVPGGVLVRDRDGAVGVSGDTSDDDETCAVAGIAAVGLFPDMGGVA